MSAANAAANHIRDWWLGTAPSTYVSMGVLSDGSYGIPKDIVFSFPCEIKNKQWKIVSFYTFYSSLNLVYMMITKIQHFMKEKSCD